MRLNADIQIVYEETMLASGFMAGIRENQVDTQRFERLSNAIEALTKAYAEKSKIDKLLVACLFEVPWEIENVVDHYRESDASLAKEISRMADDLRAKINELLWVGLEEYYENI